MRWVSWWAEPFCESVSRPGIEGLSVVSKQSLPRPYLLLDQGLPGAQNWHPRCHHDLLSSLGLLVDSKKELHFIYIYNI